MTIKSENRSELLSIFTLYYGYILFFLFFLLFPFGQLLRIEKYIAGIYVTIHPIDLITLLSLPYLYLVKKNYLFRNLENIIYIFIASLVFSLIIFKTSELKSGSLYLLRVISYYSFALLVYYISINLKVKKILLTAMFVSITFFMLLGIFQFFYFYDLRDLFYIGWDNHYYRLVSTLLDPGYSAILLIIGLLIILKSKIIKVKYLKYFLILIYLISIILTFSRAGYLTLLITLIILYKKYYKFIIVTALLILMGLLLVPKPRSSGVELYRTFSIYSRFDNYKNTFQIFKKYPLFGIGFNNICRYKTGYLNTDNELSHSCSGSDSSLLLILATTGVLGMSVFLSALYRIKNNLKNSIFDQLLAIVFISILVSSFFNNSLFYNFLMGVIAIFIGLTRRSSIPGK